MKFIKQLFIFTLVMLMLPLTSFAGTLIINQDQTVSNFLNVDVGNSQVFTIIGSRNDQITVDNETFTHDLLFDFESIETDMYFEVVNSVPNTSLEIFYSFDADVSEAVIEGTVVSFEMVDTGTYFFQAVPSIGSEVGRFTFNLENGTATLLNVHHTRNVYVEGVTSVLNAFTSKVIQFIDLNLVVLQLLVYVISFAFLIFAMFSIINLIINIHKKIREAREAKESHFKNRNNRGE